MAAKTITKKSDAEDLYKALEKCVETFETVKHALPSNKCNSKAVSLFRTRSPETKKLCREYSGLLADDVEVFGEVLKELDRLDSESAKTFSSS